ncbi:MAG: hypothetical protein RIR26_359 [Pseudomonadota bacterium]|jgi:myosin heavy subunit
MNLKQWGPRLRAIFVLLACLPVAAFGVVSWVGFGTIAELVEISKRSIGDLPADKGIEIANLLARIHDRSETLMFFVPLACAAALILVFSLVFGQFFAKLSGDCAQVLRSVRDFGLWGTQFIKTTEKMTAGAEQSGVVLEQAVGSLESLSHVLQRAVTEVGDAAKVAKMAADEAATSEAHLQSVVSSFSDLTLQDRRLEEIITTMESIAFQTNILAVNAAVEAARAGEQGRGFGIVAEAIRNLAHHSAASAKNISALIKENGESSRKAYELVRTGTTRLASASGQVKRSQSLIHKISTSAQDLTDAVGRMSQQMSHLESASRVVFAPFGAMTSTHAEWNKAMAQLTETTKNLSEALVSSAPLEPEVEPSDKGKESAAAESAESRPVPTVVKKPDTKPIEKSSLSKLSVPKLVKPTGVSIPAATRQPAPPPASTQQKAAVAPAKSRAREVIPFEGENESESTTDVKLGNISGF